MSLDASNQEKVILNLINSNKQLSASAQGNVAAAESNGQRAQVQRFGDKGGIAQVEGHKLVASLSLQSLYIYSSNLIDYFEIQNGLDQIKRTIYDMFM